MKKISIKPDFVFSPQPMYMIGTKNIDGSANFCIITWISFSLDAVPCIALTIGGSKMTKTNIIREKEFSANLITEDNIWLADYFGCTSGVKGQKNKIKYDYEWGKLVNVPILQQSNWVYECAVKKIIELEGSHFILAEIKNIQINESFASMDMKKIELEKLKPVIYAPYHYYSLGKELGSQGDWEEKVETEI